MIYSFEYVNTCPLNHKLMETLPIFILVLLSLGVMCLLETPIVRPLGNSINLVDEAVILMPLFSLGNCPSSSFAA
ncbi:MAG TPA: hypothetical protein PKC87_04190 [Candidatus Absconditabacterales bacterium]|nr:hypothetical protein [Candidatus Absconditabacterales bacterium]